MNTRLSNLLLKKGRDKKAFSEEEIEFIVELATAFGQKREHNARVANGDNDTLIIQEAQIVAMLMAIYIQGLNNDETKYLTKAMINSGETLKWPPEWKNILVDKHSTGGVGDKVSLVLAPVLAACGLKVPMISGRGLEHTGGTLDKLESIPGFNVSQTPDQMRTVLENVGCCIVEQTETLVPADKILYALRDATSTVMEFGLITGSIISKKAAESLNALVLDVKFGKGAFCKTKEQAAELAKKMENAAKENGIKESKAFLNDMNSPLGYKIGNALEVEEAIECLHGGGPKDLTDVVIQLGGHLLVSVGKANTLDEAATMITTFLQDGTAVKKFEDMLKEQGVNSEVAEKLCKKGNDVCEVLPQSKNLTKRYASISGYVHGIDALKCRQISRDLGANRKKYGDTIMHEVGLTLAVRVGDKIEKGQPWITVHHNQELTEESKKQLDENTIDIQSKPVENYNRI